MKRAIDIIASAFLIVVVAPLLLLGWLGVKLRRAQPVFTRGDGNPDSPAGLLLFNSSGNDSFSELLRTYSIDHLPVLFDVLAGKAGLWDAVRFVSRISDTRRRTTAPGDLIFRILVIIFSAMAILGLALCAPPS